MAGKAEAMKNNKLKHCVGFPRSDGAGVYESVGGPDWYGIAYEALFTVSVEHPNLVGRNIGADGEAYALFMVVGTSFATGQAAGVSAALWAESKSHDPEKVHSVLEKQGAAL
jgi:hypothetical protein